MEDVDVGAGAINLYHGETANAHHGRIGGLREFGISIGALHFGNVKL